MSMRIQWQRSPLSLALFGLLGGAAVATAGESRDETRIAMRTQSGAIEKIVVDDIDSLRPNETRAYTTGNGNAATLTRTDTGVTVAIAGERFDIALPDADGELAGLGGDIVIRKHLDEQRVQGDGKAFERKVIVRHGGEGKDAKDGLLPRKRIIIEHGENDALPEELVDLDLGDDALLLADGKARISVVRRVHREAEVQ